FERILHSAGQSYHDLIRLRTNALKDFVDAVVYPGKVAQLQKLIKWASTKKIALVPFGGGSSVVGGLEALRGRGQRAVLSVDLTRMDHCLDLDEYSRTATFEAGIYGPRLEAWLNERGFTLGHFPQSFEYSTLGGWVAARSAGQQSNHYGKIEELLVALEMISPKGELKTLRVPAGATGPDINQIVAGSEGLLGIITKSTVHVHHLPEERRYAAALFPDLQHCVDFQRELTGSSLDMAMIRVSDPEESRLFEMLANAGKSGLAHAFKQRLARQVLKFKNINSGKCLVMLGMDVEEHTARRQDVAVRALVRRYGGFFVGRAAGEKWKQGRFNMPFLRNHLMEVSIGIDTLETATSYSNVIRLHDAVIAALRSAVPSALVMCHLSHSYHDGACLYFTIIFNMSSSDPVAQWRKLKEAANQALMKNGGNMSHHHGIGVDHKSGYQKQNTTANLSLLRAMKRELDPVGILNPGKLFD
ncbi:MAG: FAD-binding oxidoreductase, partial [Leptospiraceae bacterium]|nr:FAD-binding oxidoreductase [Leptospiraceae bacterium]